MLMRGFGERVFVLLRLAADDHQAARCGAGGECRRSGASRAAAGPTPYAMSNGLPPLRLGGVHFARRSRAAIRSAAPSSASRISLFETVSLAKAAW